MVEEDTHVGSQTNAAGVGKPVTVKNKEIWPDRYLLQSTQDAGTFAEGQ